MARYVKLKLNGKPRDADYLTPGKTYPARVNAHDSTALITDDEGEGIQINLLSCPHVRPAKWEEVSDD